MPQPERKNNWGSKLLAGFKPSRKSQRKSPGQLSLWRDWEIPFGEIQDISRTFVLANCFDRTRAAEKFPDILASLEAGLHGADRPDTS